MTNGTFSLLFPQGLILPPRLPRALGQKKPDRLFRTLLRKDRPRCAPAWHRPLYALSVRWSAEVTIRINIRACSLPYSLNLFRLERRDILRHAVTPANVKHEIFKALRKPRVRLRNGLNPPRPKFLDSEHAGQNPGRRVIYALPYGTSSGKLLIF